LYADVVKVTEGCSGKFLEGLGRRNAAIVFVFVLFLRIQPFNAPAVLEQTSTMTLPRSLPMLGVKRRSQQHEGVHLGVAQQRVQPETVVKVGVLVGEWIAEQTDQAYRAAICGGTGNQTSAA